MSAIKNARKLRQEQTTPETIFWAQVRNRQFLSLKWRRQVPIYRYIVDFVCEDEKLIVELDGAQHLDAKEYDEARTEVLETYGYRVLRFWNEGVLTNVDHVLRVIEHSVGESASPHPAAGGARADLSPRRG